MFSLKRRAAKLCLCVIVSTILALLGAEGLAQFYVYFIARQGKLFTPDLVLGWRPLANLRLDRANADGRIWHIETSKLGWRSPSNWAEDKQRRLLILGDSMAFGEGVNLEDRFDQVLLKKRTNWSAINLGVMGYGTDQELIAARRYAQDLRDDDIILLLTGANDFLDVLRQKFAGRAKPWFTLEEGRLAEHPARIGWWEQIRDRSYLLAQLGAALERDPEKYDKAAWERGRMIYFALLQQELIPLAARGIHVVIAHHGDQQVAEGSGQSDPYEPLKQLPQLQNISLDPALQRFSPNEVFLKDGHWKSKGHRIVAEVLDEKLPRP